jgi:hypothetical protein
MFGDITSPGKDSFGVAAFFGVVLFVLLDISRTIVPIEP